MTESQQVNIIQTMVGSSDTQETLLAYLSIAGDKILNRLYPFGRDGEEVPLRYRYLQCEIAAYLLNKRGAEGQTAHSENGISRSYGSADVPEELMSQITPFVGVM